MGNVSIIIAECMAFRDGVLAAKNNGFLNLEIKGDSKVIWKICRRKLYQVFKKNRMDI